MSDLEARLSAALAERASGVPPATGLADGARRRLRRRRRTRSMVGGVLAVLLVAVPGGVLLARDGSPPDSAPQVATDGVVREGWRTVTYDGVEVDVPASWRRLDTSACEFGWERVGPVGSDPCEPEVGVSFYVSATFDARHGPGLRGQEGHVYAGDRAVYVKGPDAAVAWRVLASARRTGEEVPDLARGSVDLVEGGLQVTVPADPAGWSVAPATGAATRFPWVRERDGRWVGRVRRGDERLMVDAPTQGLADLVLGSVRAAPRDDDRWRTVTWRGLALDVPGGWAAGDTCGNAGEPVLTLGTDALCAGMAGYGVRLAPYPATATLAATDVMRPAEGSSWPAGAWWANVQVPGLSTVATLVTADRATGQRILDSARAADASDPVWSTVSWQDIRVDVPPGWTDGSRATWCLGEGPEEGHVQRPGTGMRTIECGRPSYGFGLTFGSSAAISLVHPSGHVWRYDDGPEYLAGSWLGYWYDDQDRLVQVNAGDRETVQRVIESVRGSSDGP